MKAQLHAPTNGRRRVCVLAVAFGSLAAGTTNAHAATWVVDRDRAQCANADFTAIQAAIDAAQPGDLIRICPDLYTESVTVDKPLTLKGDPDAVEAQECFSAAAPDPARDALVDGDDSSFAFRLEANEIVLEGLVVRGARVGIDATDRFSGYRITHNLIEANSLHGLDLGSAETHESRVDHNCIRHNDLGGLVTELDYDYLAIRDPANRTPANARDLRNARIDHNETFANPEAIALLGPGQRKDVTVDHNHSRHDGLGIGLQNSTGSAIVANEVIDFGLNAFGIGIGGGNTGLLIADNRLRGGGTGIAFQNTFLDRFPIPSKSVVLSGNDVGSARVFGIQITMNTLAESWISDNTSRDNGATGIVLAGGTSNTVTGNTTTANRVTGITLPGIANSVIRANTSSENTFNGINVGRDSTGNLISGNQANGNGSNGIVAVPGATGNRFEHNSMHGNDIFDANDQSWPSNVWIGNDCLTDFPAGMICGVG